MVIKVLVSLGIIFLSAAIGWYLDVVKKFDSPPVFWFLGAITMIIVNIVVSLF